MAYIKTTWKDRVVEYVRRYIKSGETSSEVTLFPSPGTITEEGTPITAFNLNKMETGISDAHTWLQTLNNDTDDFKRKQRMGAM